MTKNEALKAAIDGKKVRRSTWNEKEYIQFYGGRFVDEDGREITDFSWADSNKWQIVPEYVDFATAFKAYEEGKAIQSVDGDQLGEISVYHKSEKKYFGLCVDAWEIRGKWIILDD